PQTKSRTSFQGELNVNQARSSSTVVSAFILVACSLIESPAQTSKNTTRAKTTPSSKTSKNANDSFDQGAPNVPDSELRPMIERYVIDRGSLTRSYPASMSPVRQA